MKKVIGIGGVFFKAKNQAALNEWYSKHLGIELADWGTTFPWKDEPNGYTAFSIFKQDSKYYEGNFMINFRVADLDGLLNQLKVDGQKIIDNQEDEFGKFAWILDLEGNRIELWEPKE